MSHLKVEKTKKKKDADDLSQNPIHVPGRVHSAEHPLFEPHGSTSPATSASSLSVANEPSEHSHGGWSKQSEPVGS